MNPKFFVSRGQKSQLTKGSWRRIKEWVQRVSGIGKRRSGENLFMRYN